MKNVPLENMVKNAIGNVSTHIPMVFGKQFTTAYENTKSICCVNGYLFSDQPMEQ